MRRISLILSVVIAFQLASGGAKAAPISSFAGFTGPISDTAGNTSFSGVTSIKMGLLTVDFLSSPLTALGANNLQNGQLTLTTSATPGVVNGAPTSLSFAVPNTGTITPFGTLNGGNVVFNLINPLEAVVAGPTTTTFGSLTDGTLELQLASNTSNLDFGPIGTTFHLELSAQGITYTGGANGTFSSTGIPTGSFTAIAVNQVPEPASLLIWGLVGVGTCAAAYRRRKMAA
jgi:hypothetical protein